MRDGAPHLRGGRDLRRLWAIWIAAVTPCALFGLWNVGHQAAAARAALGPAAAAATGWRDRLVTATGLGHDPSSAVACTLLGLLHFVPVLLAAAAAARLWEIVFARTRGRPLRDDLGLTPLLFALTLPPTIPLWQAALGMSFGVVLAREVFGGLGKNFVNVPLAGRAFLYFAYPAQNHGAAVWIPIDGVARPTPLALGQAGGLEAIHEAGYTWAQAAVGLLPGPFGATSALFCAVGALVLVTTRAASWRVIAGGVLGLVATVWVLARVGGAAWPLATVPWQWHLVLGSFAFGLVFLATDPASAPHTDAGRWLYGALAGGLTGLVRVANPAYPEGIMLAILFANVFAPLIDQLVIRQDVRRRAARRG
jgi:Na+-transporting NADH:ubiquinone oxidoreductase subunit B